MASPKANWFLSELEQDLDLDPFEAPVQELGTKIDLRSDKDLMIRMVELVREEGDLDASCCLRARPNVVCSACPVSQAADATAHGALCRNSAEQERVMTTIAVKKERRDAGA